MLDEYSPNRLRATNNPFELVPSAAYPAADQVPLLVSLLVFLCRFCCWILLPVPLLVPMPIPLLVSLPGCSLLLVPLFSLIRSSAGSPANCRFLRPLFLLLHSTIRLYDSTTLLGTAKRSTQRQFGAPNECQLRPFIGRFIK